MSQELSKHKREVEYNIITQKKKKYSNTGSFTIAFYILNFFLHILKLLHDNFIINPISYIFFNVHNQTIIHSLIFHSLLQICQ